MKVQGAYDRLAEKRVWDTCKFVSRAAQWCTVLYESGHITREVFDRSVITLALASLTVLCDAQARGVIAR